MPPMQFHARFRWAEKIEGWNKSRTENNEAPIELSIGIHYGEVILGDIGSERRMEFATLGDTVNVANRLEELTRSLGAKIVLSDAVVKAGFKSGEAQANILLHNFHRTGETEIRGRQNKIDIWQLDRSA